MKAFVVQSASSLLALILTLLVLAAHAAEESVDPWNITGECMMVTLPQKDALAMLPDLLDEARVEAAFAKLNGMISAGTAQMASKLIVRIQSKQKGVAESIEEMRYPTEFDPPQLPQNVPLNEKLLKEWPVVGITPTAFETRNVGTTLEMEARTFDGQLIDVKCVPQHMRFLRWAKTDAGKLPNGERLTVDVPIFHSMKDTSSLILRNGQLVLIGVHKLPEPLEGMELSILRVTAVPNGAK